MGTLRKAPPPPDGWDEIRESQKSHLHPETKVYKVVGPRAVFDLKPGETGELTITPLQARDMIEAGHIVEVEEEVAEEQPIDDQVEPEAVQPEPGQSPKKKVKE